MALLRSFNKFMIILKKASTNSHFYIARKFIPHSEFRGYVCSIHNSTYCFNNSERKQLSSIYDDSNNARKEWVENAKKCSLDLEKYLNTLNIEFHDMKVNYDVLLETLKLYAESSQDIDETVGILLLNYCGNVMPDVKRELRQELCDQAWKILEKKNLQMSLIHYHTYLNICAQNHATIDPEKFIESMKVLPDDKTYQHLLSVVAKNFNSDGVVFVLAKMKELGYSVNHESFCAMIEYFSRKGDIESINFYLEKLTSLGLEQMDEFRGELAKGYAINNDIANVLKLLGTYPIENEHLLNIIKILSLSGNGKDIEKIFEFFSDEKIISNPLLHNIVIELVHSNKLDDALSIMNFFCNNYIKSKTISLLRHFLKALVKAKIFNEMVLDVGRKFYKRYSPLMILHLLLEQSLRSSQKNLSLLILEEMKNENLEIRPHFYWPLLKSAFADGGEVGILKILQHMQQMHVIIDYQTLSDYVIPYINKLDPKDTFMKLKHYDISWLVKFKSLICYLLDNGQISQALSIFKMIKRPRIDSDIISSLMEAYKKTQDIDSCLKVLKLSTRNKNRGAQFLLELVNDKSFRNDIVNVLKKVLNSYSKHELYISIKDAELISETLSFNYGRTENILDLISLSPIIIRSNNEREKNASSISILPHPRDMNEEQLENHLIELESKKMNARGSIRKLFMLYCQNNNLKRVEQLQQLLIKNNIALTPAMKACLLQLYAKNGCVDRLRDIWLDLKQNHASFIIDSWKVIYTALAFVKHDQIEMALKIITENGKAKFYCEKECWELLNAIANSAHAHLVDSTLELLLENDFCKISTITLGPLISQHLLKNDISTAVNVFKSFALKYKKIPLHRELVHVIVKKSIDSLEDKEKMQLMLEDVLKLISTIHGKKEADIDLIVSYARCGLTKKLRTALEDFNPLELSMEYLMFGMSNELKIQALTTILEVSHGALNSWRRSICESLLSIYCEVGKCQDAIDLCHKMKAEGIMSTVANENLSNLLWRYKIQMPFELK